MTRATHARDKNEAHWGRGRLGKVRPRSAVASSGTQARMPRRPARGTRRARCRGAAAPWSGMF
jgi:hypothetical protein